ncbi:MAG: carboxymuconolactone decarboxylase family protein [Bdellovibrionales bacterium]
MSYAEKVDQFLESQYPGLSSSIYRDLSLNFKKILEEGPFEPQERFQNVLAAATTLENEAMAKLAAGFLKELGTSDEIIRESAEVAGIMGMNNVYYKFRSYLPPESKDNYQRAGLRMQSLMKAASGKKVFEGMAMTVSIVNGCPMCIVSHEKAMLEHGYSADHVHELARLAATAKGLTALKKAQNVL